MSTELANFLYVSKTFFPVKLALTEEEQCRGLMFEKFPPPVMAFVYASPKINKFWMQNTQSPLDIVFCLDNKITNICQGIPFSTDLVGKNEFSDLVIEFPAGTCKAYDVNIGHQIKMIFSKQAEEKIKLIRQSK